MRCPQPAFVVLLVVPPVVVSVRAPDLGGPAVVLACLHLLWFVLVLGGPHWPPVVLVPPLLLCVASLLLQLWLGAPEIEGSGNAQVFLCIARSASLPVVEEAKVAEVDSAAAPVSGCLALLRLEPLPSKSLLFGSPASSVLFVAR